MSNYHELYAIGAYLNNELVAVKIGVSKDSNERLKTLQRNNFAHLEIMYFRTHESERIAKKFERIAKNDLRLYRIQGEWFKPTEEVLNYFPLFPTMDELIEEVFQ